MKVIDEFASVCHSCGSYARASMTLKININQIQKQFLTILTMSKSKENKLTKA